MDPQITQITQIKKKHRTENRKETPDRDRRAVFGFSNLCYLRNLWINSDSTP